MPKLSMPSEGATSAFADRSSSVSCSCERSPRTSMLVVRHAPAGEQRAERRAGRRRRREGARRSAGGSRARRETQRRQALARIVSAGEDDAVLAVSRIGPRRDQRAVRDHLERAGEASARPSAAPARRRRCGSRRDPSGSPRSGRRSRFQRSGPAACQVATTGQGASAIAATQTDGVIGSCTWRTSKRSRSSARRILRGADGLSTMLASDPLAGTITVRPTGITSARRLVVAAEPRVQEARERARAGRCR